MRPLLGLPVLQHDVRANARTVCMLQVYYRYMCRQEGNGKVKEKVAQDDIAINAVGGTGVPVGQVVLDKIRVHIAVDCRLRASCMPHRCTMKASDAIILLQANAILEEVESCTRGHTTQIVFERQADISPEALAELIQQVSPLPLPVHHAHCQ